ncbi:hypothetical protein GJ744_002855 [Endocarpon pusillum]|uniref:Uncharacterized protein n=1 Tax=Endocarpon pusillum TaxID=364733 RepID=A0A8H7A7I8_9EURO|nr:hypothetical protein GJ744_002855 [Endocarpon pusillum]
MPSVSGSDHPEYIKQTELCSKEGTCSEAMLMATEAARNQYRARGVRQTQNSWIALPAPAPPNNVFFSGDGSTVDFCTTSWLLDNYVKSLESPVYIQFNHLRADTRSGERVVHKRYAKVVRGLTFGCRTAVALSREEQVCNMMKTTNR